MFNWKCRGIMARSARNFEFWLLMQVFCTPPNWCVGNSDLYTVFLKKKILNFGCSCKYSVHLPTDVPGIQTYIIFCMIFENIFSKYKEHYKLNDRILFRCSIENLGEFYGAKRQKFWILAARASILYTSQLMCREFRLILYTVWFLKIFFPNTKNIINSMTEFYFDVQ